MLHLFTVVDRFQINEVGCVLVPGLACEPDSPRIIRGARILLRTPTGNEFSTYIKGLEMIRYLSRPEKITIPISLPHNFTADDVPVGTEVLLIREADAIVAEHRV